MERGDFAQLVGCAYLWHSQLSEPVPHEEVSLIVLAPAVSDALRDELRLLGCEISRHEAGIFRRHRGLILTANCSMEVCGGDAFRGCRPESLCCEEWQQIPAFPTKSHRKALTLVARGGAGISGWRGRRGRKMLPTPASRGTRLRVGPVNESF
jgi:hypothetical protein